MKTILIVDDVKADAIKMKNMILSQHNKEKYIFKYIDNLFNCIRFLHIHKVDLILLDLEFTEQNITAASFLNEFPSDIPIIIVSNLIHFQKPLSLKINVKGFVPKSQLQSLPNTILEVFQPFLSASKTPTVFVFPPSKHTLFPEGIRIADIRFIEFSTRNTYHIHLTDGTCKKINSVPFKTICSLIKTQNITCLQQVSRNEIINANYISTIAKLNNGRIEVTLVNLPTRKFCIGKKHEKNFEIFY